MALHTLERRQRFPITISEAWDFFSDPGNLAIITPPKMGFYITSDLPDKMHEGQIITYRIRVFPGVSVQWVTEITHVHEPHFFVDEQRFGPYRFWHHQHIFHETELGTEMKDLVFYKLPFGPIGELVHFFYVRLELDRIFDYRSRILDSMFREQ